MVLRADLATMGQVIKIPMPVTEVLYVSHCLMYGLVNVPGPK